MPAEVRLALEAMGTRFELVMAGADPARLRAAGEEAFAEIARLHRQLSAYDRASDVSWINAHASQAPVVVEPRLFALLARCRDLSDATGGAFDVTVGALMRAWRFTGQDGGAGARVPDAAVLARARAAVGFRWLRLEPSSRTVAFDRPGLAIDLGAAGKGYAIDAAVAVLREHGVPHALLHGGTSSVHAIGSAPDGEGWPVAWTSPDGRRERFVLRDSALSVSAAHGKAFTAGGRLFGHVMDVARGCPAIDARACVVTGPGSFECDALSTALLVRGPSCTGEIGCRFPGYVGIVAGQSVRM